ncbi:nitrite reductase large subunit NirB [Nocardioides jiangxiensis]|uniref:assimilatory sulfite reductase (ferredoxin) n=1 Tax=Nocardioides jiangxiensis TaxID=3064524 RepID=A0ABT9AYX6_9ACTN|nr:nitrite reductase large subunit NirB [Nocardioides sp. WY-20]MDO7867784.1 nitrite reductase large subunit NirB [Nocardioides sp. WY-20]
MSTRKTLVVAGHGMVGHRFVDAAIERGLTEQYDIVVYGEEPREAYDRVALTSYYEVGADALSFLPGGTYEDPRATVVLNTQVTAIDRAAKTVALSDGTTKAYDVLVLATGAAPFVPPVPGKDLKNVFVYRTIEDLQAIEEAAKTAKAGVVIGGGLLGLEAANALHKLDVETHVVELAPRLMAVQVDDAGGATLKRHIEKLGLTVHTGVMTEFIDADQDGVEDGKVSGLKFKDVDEVLPADIVIFSAGIRPRDQLARDCGLEVAERGGILVSPNMQTSDESIYAIGECAAPGGRMYGLVAPGYTMAEVAVDALLDGPGEFLGADMSTKLKLMGVDVASFGDAFATTEGSLELVYSDAVAGIYKKLVISEDCTKLLGGILVGDASSYGILRPMVSSGIALPENPEDLILPASRGTAQIGMPDEAQVCSCMNVTKGEICTAIHEQELTDVPSIKQCTKAGTVCGSCTNILKNLLTEEMEKSGKAVDKSICEHFAYSRQELFDLIKIGELKSFDAVVEAHGTGRGCDICKPAIASILASQFNGHVLDKATVGALQDTNDAYLANLQKNGTYSVVPRIPGGEITPEKLIVIGEVARDFNLYTKITGGQRIDMFGARMEQLPEIWRRLVDAGFESGHAYGKSLRTVKSCVGSEWCRYGVQESVAMAIELELRYRGLRSPHKLKGGVSGCARECAEARGKDFGVIATEKGWNLYVGGNGGAVPAHAQLLASDLSKEDLIKYLDRFLMYYVRTADRLQRTSTWIEQLDGGLDRVKEIVVHDALGLGEELEREMSRHVDSYFDEWKATLEDPEKVARFVSFINAPGTPDPNISFTEDRGQIRPVTFDEPVSLGSSIPVGAPQ